MDQDERPRELFASVATYATVETAVASALMREALAALLLPHTERPGVERSVRWCKRGSQRGQTAPLAGFDWQRAEAAGPLAWLVASAWRQENVQTSQSPSVAAVTMRFAEDPRRASVLELSISQALLCDPVPREAQDAVVAWARGAFARLQGVLGYLTLDYVTANAFGSMSPYEATVGLSYPWASMGFRSKVRGYFWGNLLHREHVELLGGAGRLAELSPAVLEPIHAAGPDGLYLQLTDDINDLGRDLGRERLGRLRELVRPLLPEGSPQAPGYHEALPRFRL